MSEKHHAKKILVADDSLTIQKVIRLALSGDGYEIQTVSDGKEALEQASLFRPEIMIVDVSLPVFDAYQVREHLMKKPDLKNIPVILMSSAFEKVDDALSKKLGFAGHLIKPFDPSHLRSTLLSVSNFTPPNDPVLATINEPFREPVAPRPSPSVRNSDPLGLNLPPLKKSESSFDDIRELAQNTFEMSGMDQQEWDMIEPGAQPTLTQPPHQEVSGFEMEPITPEAVSFTEGYQEPAVGTPTPHQFSVSSHDLERMIQQEVAKALEKIQGSLQEKIQQDVLNFNQHKLPLLAEKLLKEEIHKLLSEPPV